MATIAVDTFLDGGTARTAGETWTINSGAKLTIRTDSRVHANAPASMTGSLGSVTINEGEVIIDARNVRWLAYNTGTGNVPAIGTTISQGGVSGYLLGVWDSLTSAPTAAAATMPATGYIKLREVTGGAFAAGTLTGIGASATGADVAGWLEVVHDEAANITLGRLGKYTTRGDWFYLDNTTGTRAQVIQAPTNGGGANTYCPGVWVETSSGSGVYEQWPALNGAANGWSVIHMGAAEGQTDDRHKFVKMLSGGQMQFGETVTFSNTYASVAAQSSTYVDWNVSGTYTLNSNVCTVYVSAGHGLYGGETVGLDFTSGTATDQTGIATVLDAYYFTVPITASNTSGNVTVRLGATVTFTAHGLQEGNQVGMTVSTGTLPTTTTYTVHSAGSANAYNILYPHTTALTSGNCSALHTLQVTRTSHGHSIGNQVYLDFTSGGATDGVYTMRAVATNTFNVNYPHYAAITTSNVTERYEIGMVPAAGCKVRIPNIFARACTTAARASNAAPNATFGTRPEFLTTSAGTIDIQYLYNNGWYQRYGQAYSISIANSTALDTLEITECATAVTLTNVFVGHYAGGTNTALVLTSNFAGGVVSGSKFYGQGAPSGTRYAASVQYCYGFDFDSCHFGHLQYARAAFSLYANTCRDITVSNCVSANSTAVRAATSQNLTVSNLTHIDRLNGLTNATNAAYAVSIDYGSSNISVDGITWSVNQHPYSGAIYVAVSSSIKIRNVGSYDTPLPVATFEPSLYAAAYLFATSGNNSDVKIQRCSIEGVRTMLLSTVNSDKNVLIESLWCKQFYARAVNSTANRLLVLADTFLNASVKGVSSLQSLSGQASVYGTHFHSLWWGKDKGEIALCMNEPTVETAGYFTMVSGTAKFNSSGGILMGVIGNQAVWETKDWIIGHTGFQNVAPVMVNSLISNYTLEYQIDTGSGYSAWKTLNGTNLSGETISPATGFKLKIRITTTSTNTAAINFLRIYTTTTEAAQADNLYPLDVNSLTITGLPTGCDAFVLSAGTNTVLDQRDSIGATSYTYTYSGAQNVDVGIIKPGYIPYYIRNLSLTAADSSIPVALTPDRNYA